MPDANSQPDLASLFHRVSRAVRKQTSAALHPHGITPHQARAMMLLARAAAQYPDSAGGLRNSQLAEQLRIAARSATEVVDQLQDKALVQRTPDPSDRRAWIITLTDRGRELSTLIREDRRVQMNDFFSRLDANDQQELRRILGSLVQDEDQHLHR
ncbi:MarR family transcriptional regulator [Glutamicibacter sp. MNS18]|uniref:MarR family winged helix-turn-helix transcriptional regulator n=1 Tax=Glutamicibacter sp. MNS18 TaxID=2989817 RepID=UPI002236B127|nr:MarR family transcriptional regulator [Glutamicibacter sp. MNS18]MCW4467175.1 MarR family transcriptional regulator [Glutamicibacter sp. MNS18]